MWTAVFWGTFAASATVIGALAVVKFSIPNRLIGFIMALGIGALIGATSYELLEKSVETSGFMEVGIGFLGGALVFTVLDYYVSHRGGHQRKHTERTGKTPEFWQRSSNKTSNKSSEPTGGREVSGTGIFIGTVMDTLPESALIGMSLIGGSSVSLTLVVSIFISNIPEGLSSTIGLQKSGYSLKKIFVLWGLVVFFSALSSLAGAVLLENASNSIKAIVSCFAGGAIIAMIASTMMPEAFKEGGPVVGFVTSVGIFISLWLHYL